MMRLISPICLCFALVCGAAFAVMAQQPRPTATPYDAAKAVEGAEAQEGRNIQFWVGALEDYGAQGSPYGCGSYLLPVDSGVPRSDDTLADLRIALAALLNPEISHPAAETEDWLQSLELAVESIRIEAGLAEIQLGGALIGPGHCGDALIEGQLLRTVFQFESIERVRIVVGRSNLWDMMELTGWYSQAYKDNYVYERPGVEAQPIQIWLGTFEDYAAAGIPHGCGSYLLPVDTAMARSGNPIGDLYAALEALFNPELAHPQAETEDWLRRLGLSVEQITLEQGEAVITLGGELLGVGSCGDAIMEGQILQTIFQFEAIERVKISAGDANLREIIDMSDSLDAEELRNYIYARLED